MKPSTSLPIYVSMYPSTSIHLSCSYLWVYHLSIYHNLYHLSRIHYLPSIYPSPTYAMSFITYLSSIYHLLYIYIYVKSIYLFIYLVIALILILKAPESVSLIKSCRWIKILSENFNLNHFSRKSNLIEFPYKRYAVTIWHLISSFLQHRGRYDFY